MKITIFVSVYNRITKLQRLIKSAEEQDYLNWELIIFDDGSTDGLDKCFGTQKKDNETIKYIRFQENRGHPEALLEGSICDLITGDLVVFIGSDDCFIDNTVFSKMVEDFQRCSNAVWKIGYLWKGEDRANKIPDQFKTLGHELKYFSHQVLLDNYLQSDYLFVYRKT
jgi:glycosyltransferase involved in cell wall biosynthesis